MMPRYVHSNPKHMHIINETPAQNIVTINAQAQRTVLGQRNDLKNIETPTLYFKEEEVNTLVP